MKWWWSIVLLMVIWTFNNVSALPGYDDYYGGGGGDHNVIHKVVDYYAKPKYAFGYEVDGLDEYFRELSHGRWEIRDGDVTQGQYRVLLPDNRIQIVSYIADKFGYRPTIQYINKGIPPPPPPAYAHVKVPKILQQVPIVPLPVPVINDHHQHQISPFSGGQYGPGFGYGGGGGGIHGPFQHHQQEPIFALGSSPTGNVRKVVVSRNRKRALQRASALYDRTLFRKDVERRRRSNKKTEVLPVPPQTTPVSLPLPVPQTTQ